MIIAPQIILFYKTNVIISKVLILSYEKNIEGSKAWDLYNLIKSEPTNIIETEPEIVEDHIILTYNLEYCKGYVKNLLKLDSDIILFSLFHNIEYYYKNNEIFNPFKLTTVNYSNLLKYNENTYLYELSSDITDGLVLCVTTDANINYLNIHLGSSGIYKSIHKNLIKKIIDNIILHNYELVTNIKTENKYISNIDMKHVLKLSKISDYKKKLILKNNDKYYVSGDDISIINNIDDYYRYLNIIDDDDNDIVTVIDDELLLADYKQFIKFLHNYDITDVSINYNKINIKIEILFNILLKPGLIIEYDYIDFFLIHTKTKNIFLLNKINIILSKNHIQFTSNKITKDFAKYLTLFILGYNNIYNEIKSNEGIKKVHDIYTSRYCQDSKKIKRKPILIEKFDKSNYKKISDNFYEGKTDYNNSIIKKGTVKIYENYRYGDIYIDKYNLIYTCIDPNYSRIGFLENIYSMSRECYACCYSKQKILSNAYNNCIFNTDDENKKELDDDETINGFLLNFGRLILNKSKISILPTFLNKILNKNAIINITSNTNRIINADKYCVIAAYFPSITLRNFDDIYNFLKNKNAIIIDKKSILLYEYLKINKDTKLFIIIQNKLHIIKEIFKSTKSDKITILDISFENIKLIYDLFTNIKFHFDTHYNNIKMINGKTYYNNIEIKKKPINYFVEYKQYHKYNDKIYTFISNYLDRYISKFIDTNNINLFKRIFMIKLLDHLNITNISVNENMIIDYIDKKFNN
jgi:hypothetical protein